MGQCKVRILLLGKIWVIVLHLKETLKLDQISFAAVLPHIGADNRLDGNNGFNRPSYRNVKTQSTSRHPQVPHDQKPVALLP